eukprot:15440608-Alexandrium_andersonii.AAC.1
MREIQKVATRARTWNCAGPGVDSKLVPEAPEGCIPRCFAQIPNPPTKWVTDGVRCREIAKSSAPIRNPPIRSPR